MEIFSKLSKFWYFLILSKLAVNLVGQFVEADRHLIDRVLVNIDSYYSYEIYGADGSFRVFDSYVRAGREYAGHLPPNRVKMRHEVLVDTSSMTPYGVFTFTGKRSNFYAYDFNFMPSGLFRPF